MLWARTKDNRIVCSTSLKSTDEIVASSENPISLLRCGDLVEVNNRIQQVYKTNGAISKPRITYYSIDMIIKYQIEVSGIWTQDLNGNYIKQNVFFKKVPKYDIVFTSEE